MSVISSRYSEALFDLACEEKCIEDIYESYKVITSIFRLQSDLIDVLSHPEIVLEDKINIVKDAFLNTNKNLLNFICVLIEKRRLKEVYNIFDDFEMIYNAHFNISVAKVYTVEKLSDSQVLSLKSKLGLKLNKEIHIDNVIDKSLIGGMKIVIDNHVMDHSIKTKISELSNELHKIQIR
ncbi:MAG: ATP synthase F1 subunit delta [Bacilli bacterium]